MSILSHYLFRLFHVLSRYFLYLVNLFRVLPFFTTPPKRRSVDLYADARRDFHSNGMKSNFIFYQHCIQKEYNDIKKGYNLGIYFRGWDRLDRLEKKLIDLSYGNILDIGSSTGYYIPYLMEKGNVTGIEISPIINNIARKRGIENCIIGDFYTYQFNGTFDTIMLIGNDIALSGTLRS